MSHRIARNLAISFFAATVLLAETLFFHVTNFVLSYVPAMTVISCAVAGIGVGAFLATPRRIGNRDLFAWCCGGTTVCLYIAAFVLLRHPSLPALLAATSAIFVFPSLFIASAFARGTAARVYLYDMLGAGAAVGLVVLAFHWLGSEELFLLLVIVLPLVGGVWAAILSSQPPKLRVAESAVLVALSCIGAGLLYYHLPAHRLNITRLVNPRAAGIPERNLLRRESRLRVATTYDSLEGRLDVIPGSQRIYVTYDGFFNDNFTPSKAPDYLDYAKPHGIEYPSRDKRVVYGLIPEPSVFVIGPATTGIIKTLRMLTPVERIDAVEINPGILQIMQRDYYEASGEAYKGLRPLLGNALSVLRRSKKKFDIITLINTHSSRWIGALGPSDFLHTRESYDTYFDHLTDDGYLLFEERPVTRRGELGLRRIILTLCDCLKRRGAEDPSEHFFIWEFMSRRHLEQGKHGIEPRNDMYYVGMVVTRSPLEGEARQRVIDWHKRRTAIYDEYGFAVWREPNATVYPAYLKGTWGNERFGTFFEMMASGDFSGLEAGFDATVVTNDRPFPSCALSSIPEVEHLVAVTAGICLLLCGLFVVAAMRGEQFKGQMATLLVYNLTIGFAYFLVEIMLIQAYHSVFLSPSTSLVLVLGVLLIGSGLGGLLTGRLSPTAATCALAPLLLLGVRLPNWMIAAGWPTVAATSSAVAMVFAVGFLMGVFFPTGLHLADCWKMRAKVPHLFAVNCVAGSLATVVSLYLGIRVGYTWTLIVALALYAFAAVAFRRSATHISIQSKPTGNSTAEAANVCTQIESSVAVMVSKRQGRPPHEEPLLPHETPLPSVAGAAPSDGFSPNVWTGPR